MITEGELKGKIIFLEFFMQQCPWCYKTMDDYNRLIDDLLEWYGPEKVDFVAVDGPNAREFGVYFQAYSYPTFTSVIPEKGAVPHLRFSTSPRNYETLKAWALQVMGNTPLRPGVRLPNQEEDRKLQALRDQID